MRPSLLVLAALAGGGLLGSRAPRIDPEVFSLRFAEGVREAEATGPSRPPDEEGVVVTDLGARERRRWGPVLGKGGGPPRSIEPRIIRASPRKILFEVRTGSPGFLLFSSPYHPDWRVHVYGGSRDLVRAEGSRMGVFVDPGTQTISLTVDPWRERLGWALLGLAALMGISWGLGRARLDLRDLLKRLALRLRNLVSFDVAWVSAACFLPLFAWLFYLTHDSGANLSHEDPGRDLYVVWRITEGEWPVKDFQWQNGLLALLYYAGCFLAFGVKAVTLMSAYKVLQTGACFFVFLTVRRLGGGPLALAAALVQFSLTDPWHSYNHIAATFLISVMTYLMARFHPPQVRLDGKRLALVLAVAWGVAQCKITMGFATLAAAAVFVGAKHLQAPPPRPRFWPRVLLIGVGASLANLLPYLVLLSFQPLARWPLCLGVGHGGKGVGGMAYTITWEMMWKAADHLLNRRLWEFLEPYDFLLFGLWFFGAAVVVWAATGLFRWKRGREPFPVLPVAAFACFLLWGHEFVGPRNVATIAYHLSPLFMVLFACLLWRPFAVLDERWRPWAGRALFAAATLYCFVRVTDRPVAFKAASVLWDHPRCGLRVHPTPYMETLARVTERLERTTRPDEEIAAIPRGSLYLFLADRKRATWLEEMHIQFMPPEEEARIVSELRGKRVRTVLYSNLARYIYFPGNNFGEDFAFDLARILEEDYVEAARIPEGELLVFGVNVHAWDFNYHQILFLERR